MQTITTFDNTAEGWERSLYAFLAEALVRTAVPIVSTCELNGRDLAIPLDE